jgi:hypothetical protein
MTPLPAARPEVLTTMGAPCCLMYALASSGLVKVSYAAVGMLCFLQMSCTGRACGAGVSRTAGLR